MKLVHRTPTHSVGYRDPFADFDRVFKLWNTDCASVQDWRPALDVRESENGLHIQLDLPGVSREDVKVSIEDDVLTIAGERKIERSEENAEYHRVERASGTFERALRLPHEVATDKVTASFKDGVLQVELPKSEAARPKEIAVDVE